MQSTGRNMEDGFTLVELLIVVVILGILGGIVVFAVGDITGNAANHACQTEAREFVNSYVAYQANHHGTAVVGTTPQMAQLLHDDAVLSSATLSYLDPAQGGTIASASSARWTFDATRHDADTTHC